MTSIEDLPDEVLEKIISYLPFLSWNDARLVSKRWLNVCNSCKITKLKRVALRRQDLPLFRDPKAFLNLQLYNSQSQGFNKEERQFWIKYGWSVQYLTMKMLHPHCPMLHDIINYCTNAEDLTLEFTRGEDNPNNVVHEVLNAKLNALANLTISGVIASDFATGKPFLRLTKSVPNLKSLRFQCVNVNKNNELLIVNQAFTLTKIMFCRCSFEQDTPFESILYQMGPQLISLHLCETPVTIKIDEKHADTLCNLKIIDFSGAFLDSVYCLIYFKNLQFVSFSSSDLSDAILLSLDKLLKHLKGLDISSTRCTGQGVLNVFRWKLHPNLIAFKMAKLVNITDDVLFSILPNLPNLKFLDVSFCNITSIGAQTIFLNCKQLTHLFLESCNVSELIHPISINTLVNLSFLNLYGCRLHFENILQLRLEKLITIGLSGDLLSQEVKKNLLENFPHLQLVFLGKVTFNYQFTIRERDLFFFELMTGYSIFDLYTD